MTYAQSQPILSTDFNNIVGVSNTPGSALGPYSSEAAATNVGGLYGVGRGSFGYGRTAPTLATTSQGGVIRAAEWNALVTINNTIATKTGTTITNYAPITTGNRVAFLTNLQANISTLVTNRFNSPTRALSAVKVTATRVANWGFGGATTINAVVNATFPSGDAARYFFNSGSEILLRVRHGSTATPQDLNWNTFLSTQVGDIFFGANGTRQVASTPGGTVATTLGYWTPLGATLTNIFTRTAGTGAYSGGLVATIQAARVGAANVAGNGDNGVTIQFSVSLTDNHTGSGDLVAGNQTTFQVFDNLNTAGFTPVGTTSAIIVTQF